MVHIHGGRTPHQAVPSPWRLTIGRRPAHWMTGFRECALLGSQPPITLLCTSRGASPLRPGVTSTMPIASDPRYVKPPAYGCVPPTAKDALSGAPCAPPGLDQPRDSRHQQAQGSSRPKPRLRDPAPRDAGPCPGQAFGSLRGRNHSASLSRQSGSVVSVTA
jgi:hypothetical protein